MTIVVPSERDGGKAQRPDPIIDFFEGDMFAGQGFRQKYRCAVPRHLANRRHAADFDMPGILERRKMTRQGARRGAIATGRHGVRQRRVRPLLVVFDTKATEAALLCRRIARRGAVPFRL